MEFSIEAFKQDPSRELLESCRKTDLYLVADFYSVPVIKTARKKVVRDVIEAALIQQGILEPRPNVEVGMNAATGVEVNTEAPESDPMLRSLSGVNSDDLRLAIQLKQLDLEIKRQEHTTQLLRFRQCELETQAGSRSLGLVKTQMPLSTPPNVGNSPPFASLSGTPNLDDFDVSRHLTLVPVFRDNEVDSYFGAFERIASALRWPREAWPLMIQCKLSGKAQEICSTLSVSDSLDYDKLKNAVLKAYELVPEAYRQKFRSHVKVAGQTYVEYAREKNVLFDRWCSSSRVANLEQLRELMLIEDFKNSLPDKIVVYLNEKKVCTLAEAAVCADEFTLTHKNLFAARRETYSAMPLERSVKVSKSPKPVIPVEARECFYCHELGHLIVTCPSLKKKNKGKSTKSVGFVHKIGGQLNPDIDAAYDPFVCEGVISLSGSEEDLVPVTMLRDTGANQSFVLARALPFSEKSYCGSDVLIQGIELGVLKVPLHNVYIRSGLVTGFVKLAVRHELPVSGVALIVGNDLAGEKVLPIPEVIENPVFDSVISGELASEFPSVFTACVVTRAQARKFGDSIGLSDTFMATEGRAKIERSVVTSELPDLEALSMSNGAEMDSAELSLSADKVLISAEQQKDPSLLGCRKRAVTLTDIEGKSVGYFWDSDVLKRKWTPARSDGLSWDTVYQLVVPKCLRNQVLSVAHDNVAGHLGITKTYYRILRYFFWPGIKSDVVQYCRSCHVCQVVGKPNQIIRPAPLQPIPVLGEPFARIILDCVGPLPRTRAGHVYLLTLMCTTTRYPEAVPLRSLKAKAVVRALVTFFSTFGFPKVIQTDQGTNFMSRLFKQVLSQLKITHVTSSPYRPETQGALERFHQTLKSMLSKYCVESGKDWDEGLPLLMFAVRETVQESLGFSPAELVFGHTVRGPLKMLKENWLSEQRSECNLLNYVGSFRERLHDACKLAQAALESTQTKMKRRFDKTAVVRSFSEGDKVLVLLPVQGAALQAKFSGPYVVDKKLSDTNYVIRTPERRRKSRVCHVNMLKLYVGREEGEESKSSVIIPVALAVSVSDSDVDEDGLSLHNTLVSGDKLNNSMVLENLNSQLVHLSDPQRNDIIKIINSSLGLFSDIPTRTQVLEHDIDVGDHSPIKQSAYRVNPVKRKIMEAEVKYLVENGLAVPSSSAWSSPCLLVPKSDGTQRFCTDYRKVNAVTKPDSFPLPLMEDCIDKVGSARFVTKLDLLKGYWQVPLTERAAEISAFVTPDDFLNYRVMAFGLRNAPATFQRLMNKVLKGVHSCKAYLDDIVIYSNTWDEHLKTLSIVFDRLLKSSLTLNLVKCEFGKATVTYLGKRVGQGQVRPVALKVQAIVEFAVPRTKRELRRFLGMTGYYRGFCKNFSDVVLPLTNMLRASQNFEWTAKCQTAFDSVKTLLCSAPVLAAPRYECSFKMDVDASANGAGAVLLQDDENGVEHPVGYFSKKFLKHQLNYSTIEKEALALLMALQHFEVYIGSSSLPVIVFTDHNPLVFLSRMKNSNQRIMRWSLFVQDFYLEIRYKKGKDNVLADALSRSFSSE